MAARVSVKKKVPELNILKSLAFLAVVFQSSMMFAINQPTVSAEQAVMIGMFFNFAKFSAPAFIFITGFALLYHHEKQVHYQHYILEKTSELIVPYLFWTMIYLIASHSFSYGEAIKAVLAGTAAPHLWYVVMVFQFHLLFPIIFVVFHSVTRKIHSKNDVYKIMAACVFGYAALTWLSVRYIFNGKPLTHSALLLYTDRSFLSYSFYFILGGTAALTLPNWRKYVMKYVPLNTFLFLILFIIVGYELLSFDGVNNIHLQVSTYLKPSMFFYIVSELLLLYALSMTIVQSRTFIYKILDFIGKFTYGAYLAHLFFLHICVKLLEPFALPTGSLVYGLVLFAATTALSVTSMFLLSYIPFGKIITGPTVRIPLHLPQFLHIFEPIIGKAKNK